MLKIIMKSMTELMKEMSLQRKRRKEFYSSVGDIEPLMGEFAGGLNNGFACLLPEDPLVVKSLIEEYATGEFADPNGQKISRTTIVNRGDSKYLVLERV